MNRLEQFSQSLQARVTEMPELPDVQRGQRCVEFSENRKPLLGDPRFDDAPVAAFALPHDEALKGQPVEQPRQIGGVSEQTCGDLTTRQSLRAAVRCPTQNPQDIKLRRAQTVRPKKFGNVVPEGERQTLKTQVDLVLEAGEFG